MGMDNQNQAEGLRGLKRDPDAWAAGILSVGSAGAKILSIAEHIDFLMSVNDGHFKMIFDFWDSIGWFLALGGGIIWIIFRILSPKSSAKTSLTWGMVFAVGFVAFVFGSLWTTISSDALPRVVIGWGGGGGCQANLDTSRLKSFASDYKLALICLVGDPIIDPMQDTNIAVSNLFTILPGGITIIADPSKMMARFKLQTAPAIAPTTTPPPSNATGTNPNPANMGVNQPPQAPVQAQVGYLAVLVPKDITREKITTLEDLERLGGKILDPRYYRD